MPPFIKSISVTLSLSLAVRAQSSCPSPDETLCYVPTSLQTSDLPSLDASSYASSLAFEGNLEDIVNAEVIKRNVAGVVETDAHLLAKRQQYVLCCRPAPVRCLYSENIPFCYNFDTTAYFLPDGSYGVLSEGTYNDVDGTKINYETGTYTFPNGTVLNFQPETISVSSSVASSTVALSSTHSGPSTSQIATTTTQATSTTAAAQTNNAGTSATASTTSPSPSSSLPKNDAQGRLAASPIMYGLLVALAGSFLVRLAI